MQEGKKPLSLQELREKWGITSALERDGADVIPCRSLARGVPRGVISEITGTARTEWMTSLLAENNELVTFWAEEKLTLLPTALQQRGVELSRVLMAETGGRLFQTIRKALKSKLFDCVILPGAIEEIKMLKALQLFARESNACVFFLSKQEQSAWAIPFQVHVDWLDGCHEYKARVVKSKLSTLAARA